MNVMYFSYFFLLFLSLNEIITTNAASSSRGSVAKAQLDGIERTIPANLGETISNLPLGDTLGNSTLPDILIREINQASSYAPGTPVSPDHELIPCPHAYFTEKLNPYDEEKSRIFNEKCKKLCSENIFYHGIWYINKKGKKGAACWNTFRNAKIFSYDSKKEICECGMDIKKQGKYQRCIPRMVINDISSSQLCEDECKKRKVHANKSRKGTYNSGFCFVKNGYKYPNLLGKTTFKENHKDKQLKCHCAVESLSENALNSVEDRRELYCPSNELYSPVELRAIVNALKTEEPVDLSKVSFNLSASLGSSSRTVPASLEGGIPRKTVGINPDSLLSTLPKISISSERTFPGNIRNYIPAVKTLPDQGIGAFSQDSALAFPTDRSRRKNPHASSSIIFVPPTRASTEDLEIHNRFQLSLDPPRTSTKIIQTDHVKLLPCPIALFTEKLQPYNAEAENNFTALCKKSCNENQSHHGTWYINENGDKEAACWTSYYKHGIKIKYNETEKMCECGIHLNSRSREKPCKPKMEIRGISSSDLCDNECGKKRIHTYNSETRTYTLGFCYVKDDYSYPNLVGKTTFTENHTDHELKCHCAVEGLPANYLGAISKRQKTFQPGNEHYSPNELHAILDALRTGKSDNLSIVLFKLSASPERERLDPTISGSEIPRTVVGTSASSLVSTFPRMSSGGTLGNLARPNSESSATAIEEIETRVISSTFPGNVPENITDTSARKAIPDHLIGKFSQASVGGVRLDTSEKSHFTDIATRKKSHASLNTTFVPPTRTFVNLLKQNHPQLSSVPSSSSIKAIQTCTRANESSNNFLKPVPHRLAGAVSPGTKFSNATAMPIWNNSVNTSAHGLSRNNSTISAGTFPNTLLRSSLSGTVIPNAQYGSLNVNSATSERSYLYTLERSILSNLGNPNNQSLNEDHPISLITAPKQVDSESVETALTLGGVYTRNTNLSPNPVTKKQRGLQNID